MWSTLVDMTRDDCCRTLRRLELEAYSKMMSVLRAQGALEDSRRKLLEELRVVLRISDDRHSAEARRVANDELLANIADQISGPNTGLGWLCEGRRKVPMLPRGIPQTMFTELADKFAEKYAAENKDFLKKLAASKPKISEERNPVPSSSYYSNDHVSEHSYPIATEDPAIKLWETELNSRKRKIPESLVIEDVTRPVKNVKNLPVNNQKYLNISQLYSKFSQQIANKPSQSKHSYNQVKKVSTNKSSSTRGTTIRRPRGAKNTSLTKAQLKKIRESSKHNALNPNSPQLEYTGPPNTFQASYAKSVLGSKSAMELSEENCHEVAPSEAKPIEQVAPRPPPPPLPPPPPPPNEEHPPTLTPTQQTNAFSGKSYQLVIKKSQINMDKKISDLKLVQKPIEGGIKVISNRQVLVTPSTAQRINPTSKYVTTKVIGPVVTKTSTPIVPEKMIVVSKSIDQKLVTSKFLATSTPLPASNAAALVTANHTSVTPKVTETITPKGIPATDLKVSAKTFLLNPKPGQKMVVFPAKGRTKASGDGQTMPLIQLKGMSTPMRLVPMGSPGVAPARASPGLMGTPTASLSSTKAMASETIKTANMADIVPVKGLPTAPAPAPRPPPANTRTVTSKSNVIVVQKGSPLIKTIPFTKNGNDISKIIMGKNITQLMQAKQETEAAKDVGNVILLDLNNDQTARATTMSEILDSRSSNTSRTEDGKRDIQKITEDTPVFFDAQISEEVCNTNSLDSATGSIGEMVTLEAMPAESSSQKPPEAEGAKRTPPSVTDWEIELDTVSRKNKEEDKLNSLHLDLGISSDSEGEFIGDAKTKTKLTNFKPRRPSADSKEFEPSSGLNYAARTLLSQFQDDGSSSNDSSFTLRAKLCHQADAKPESPLTKSESPLTKSESDALAKVKEKLSEKVAKCQQQRIDVYSTAISSSEINLDSFSYLEEGMLGDEDYTPRERPDSVDSNVVSENSPSK